MKSKNKRGMTLVEILIAALIFSVTLAAVLGNISAIIAIIDDARDTTQATGDLTTMLERLKATPFDSITTKFTNGVADGPGTNPYASIVNGYALRNEHITVIYANPNTDPLEIKTTITWQNKNGRSFSAALATFRTR